MSRAGPWARAGRRLRRNRAALAGAGLLVATTALCTLGPPLLGLDPGSTRLELRNLPPSAAHWFGTDTVGRDLFARVLVGGRTSLLIGLAATLASVLIGVLYGGVAGYYGGRLDEFMMRTVDFLYGVPYMFLVILIMLLFSDTARGEALPVFLALGLVQWLTMARIVRGQVRSLKHMPFVDAARMGGSRASGIVFRHLLPHTVGPVVVYTSLTVPVVIMEESFLAFIGLQVQYRGMVLDSWGALIARGVSGLGQHGEKAWLLVFPALVMVLMLLSLNAVGDALRDSFDPREDAR